MQTARQLTGRSEYMATKIAAAMYVNRPCHAPSNHGGPLSTPKFIANSTVEIVCGVVMVALGVVLQVGETSAAEPDQTILVVGGLLIALGGILLSWIASRAFAETQSQKAVAEARAEVDLKLDNLSRVLGQAAGQISQAIEQHDLEQSRADTCMALVSQANRMIYGQVNEIAVIRGTSFDSGYLLETASTLDGLARELSLPGNPGDAQIDSVRRRIEDVRADLATSKAVTGRSYLPEIATCPHCRTSVSAKLGSVPGDTAAAICTSCQRSLNVHRAANGSAFSRPRGGSQPGLPPSLARWSFQCPSCGNSMSSTALGGPKVMVCLKCSAAINVEPTARSVVLDGEFRREYLTAFERQGSRPRVACPTCNASVNAHLITDEGYFGTCVTDRVLVVITKDVWDAN